jgi:hypothetical protein
LSKLEALLRFWAGSGNTVLREENLSFLDRALEKVYA